MEHYDLILVGSSFASTFFLQRWLQSAPPTARVLVLERGQDDAHHWQTKNRLPSSYTEPTFTQGGIGHNWIATIGFGGGSNCWWGCTPRMHPTDFELKSRYGVGLDWPFSYDDLEPYYEQAEATMGISGHCDEGPFRRRSPFPLPPHNMNGVGRALREAYGKNMIPQPTARASIPHGRAACQANAVCTVCPMDAKFTIRNGFRELYADPRITLKLGSTVQQVITNGNVATGVSWRTDAGEDHSASADVVGLGASAMANPYLLLRSDFSDPWLGKGLNEQVSLSVSFDLAGLDSLDGSTSITGHLYEWYDGPWRSERAAILIENFNKPALRNEFGKWRQRGYMKLIFEEIPEQRNHVSVDPNNPGRPIATYMGHSDYAQRSVDFARANLHKLLAPLPIERLTIDKELQTTEAHIQGTHRMGTDPSSSVVDPDLVHHKVRNLLVLGAGTFPTSSPANPTLTLAALSLRAAERFVARGAL